MASIRKRTLPSGEVRWMVDFKDANGKRRAKMFEKKRDADGFLVTARAQVAEGTFVHSRDSVTVKQAAEHWIEQCRVRRDAGQRMEAATYKNYETVVRLHILDERIRIGALKVSRLDIELVETFQRRLMDNGRSAYLAKTTISVLGLILKAAKRKKWCTINPVDDVEQLTCRRAPGHTQMPTDEEVAKLIANACPVLKPMLMVAAFCGLRASELRGLTWDNVDLDSKVIKVVQRVDYRNVFGPPKTTAGFREVPVADQVILALREWRVRSRQDCMKTDLNLVFPNRNGLPRRHNDLLRKYFWPLIEKLGIEMRWHGLRHYAVSCWLRQGYSIKEAQTFAGHASAQMTIDRYGHYLPKGDQHSGMNKIFHSVYLQHQCNTGE